MSAYEYPGDELSLFAQARHWKAYFASRMRSCLHGAVLEVGAGMGETTATLMNEDCASWLCLEPDGRLRDTLARRVQTLPGSGRIEVVSGTLLTLDAARRFDCVLYIDVIEHIEDDRRELQLAADRLLPGGSLVVLAPAHQWLFTPFDEAIGHFRRYDRAMLRAAAPAELAEVQLAYLDSVGLLCSLGNRLWLGRAQPSVANILFWDRCMVPISRVLDPLLGRRVGKSILGIWRKPLACVAGEGGQTGDC